MKQTGKTPLLSWGVVGLLACLPTIRGGHQLWVALLVALGMWLLIATAVASACWRGTLRLRWGAFDLALLGGLAWVASSLFLPAAPPDAALAFLILLGCLGCVLLARHVALTDHAVPFAMGLCVAAAGIVGVGFLQLFGLLGHRWWNPPQFLAATFVNHNHLAAYLELLFPVSCALWLTVPMSPARRFLIALSSALLGLGLLVSCSRGAWLSLALATMIGGLFLMAKPRQAVGWTWRRTLGAAGLVCVVGFLVSRPLILKQLGSLLDVPSDTSWQMRQAIWQGATRLILVHPWVGQGLGSFLAQFPHYRPEGLYRLIDYAHHEYLQLIAELGDIGFGWLALLAGLVGWRLTRMVVRSRTPWKQGLGMGALVGLMSLAIHSLVDFPWHIPAVTFTLAAVVGLVMGIPYHADAQRLHEARLALTRWRLLAIRWVGIPLLAASALMVLHVATEAIVSDRTYHQGRLRQDAGRLEEAAVLYRQAIQHLPQHMEARRRLGETLTALAFRAQPSSRRGYLEQARDAARSVLDRVPDDAPSSHALGQALLVLGHPDDAIVWHESAVRHDPHNPLYWKHWAESLLLVGRVNEAAAAFQRAAHLGGYDPIFRKRFEELRDPRHFARLGFFALPLGRLGMAERAFTLAQRLQPDYPEARLGLALCALSRGERETAERLIAAIDAPALRSRWFAGLAQWHHARQEWDVARQALTMSLSLDSANPLAHHLNVVLARQTQDGSFAKEALEQLLALNRPPVFVRTNPTHGRLVVWEPEQGRYSTGQHTQGGWLLHSNGAIEQALALPPGRATFAVTVKGTRANGRGPQLVLSWNGRLLLETEVASETWATYAVQSEVKPGESLISVAFANDEADPITREDRNLKVDSVSVTWRPL